MAALVAMLATAPPAAAALERACGLDPSLCAGKPCWRSRGDDRVRYQNRERLPDGVDTMQLHAGVAGKARISAKAKGAALDLPALPLALPARVQLQRQNGPCWEATYTTTQRNDGRRFKASSP